MKKAFTILAVILVLIVGMFSCLFVVVGGAEKELNTFIEPMIIELADSNWNTENVNKYSSKVMQEWFKTNGYDSSMPIFRKLGKVKEYKGMYQFERVASSATVIAIVEFENGLASLTLSLSKQNDLWKMNSINIQSPPAIALDVNQKLYNSK